MISVRGFFAVGLCLPRDSANVAHALRACGAFGAAFLAFSGQRYQKHAADTQKAYRHMPLHRAGDNPEDIMNLLPYECTPVAVEIYPGAIPLPAYTHPERAYYIFGPEDGSIPERVIQKCEHVVRIPSLHCINLATAVSVVLYDRVSKRAPNQALYANGSMLQAEAS